MLHRVQLELSREEDWTEKLIQSIARRPALYTIDHHCDREMVARLWIEVCAEVVFKWEELNEYEKADKVRDIRGKWRNLRTCFRREIYKQRQEVPGVKKRRKYIYYDKLLFLLPTMEDLYEGSPPNVPEQISEPEEDPDHLALDPLEDETRSCDINTSKSKKKKTQNVSNKDTTEVEYCSSILYEDIHETKFNPEIIDTGQLWNNSDTPVTITQSNSQPSTRKRSKLLNQRILECEEISSNILHGKNQEEFDEDKLFLLSLIPSFRKLNEMKKFEAKIEFLGILKRITQGNQKD